MSTCVGCKVRPHARDLPEPPDMRKPLARCSFNRRLCKVQTACSPASPKITRRFDERVQSVTRHGRITEHCSKRKEPPICTHSAEDPTAKKQRCWCGGPRSHQSEAGRPFYRAHQHGSNHGRPWFVRRSGVASFLMDVLMGGTRPEGDITDA